ncbi:LCP family protein [Streptomyces sp. NPDC014006]|uniref:LCP family protein n=1 Tax=Streptomyces sp. NPDC014006 TaxID=3364870 RepID=UPI0036FAD2E8
MTPITRRRWALRTGVGLTAVLLAAAVTVAVLYAKLDGNITADEAAARELARYEKERPTALSKDAQNILLIGSDSRAGTGNDRYGHDSGTERSDTTILLHLSTGRHSATAVSLPRDLMVDIPACLRRDGTGTGTGTGKDTAGGTRSEPTFAMFNQAFQTGGSACTIRTVEKLTGVRVDHHVVIDFSGFKEMVDAVDGVQICLTRPIHDTAAKLHLPAGRVTLNGEQALGYVRARKSLGDGSDTDRMDRQQRFLAALVNKVRGNGVLLNPVKLYPVLDAATSSLTTDPALANLRGLYQLVRGLRDIPTEHVQFLTVPRESYVYNANRDQLVEPEAERLFALLRRDKPVQVAASVTENAPSDYTPSGTRGEKPSDSPTGSPSPGPASPDPTFRGNTAAHAAHDTCE